MSRHPRVAKGEMVLIAAAAMFPMLGGCDGAPPSLYGDNPVQQNPPQEHMPPPPDMAVVPYPEGPYGNQEGETLADFSLEGYRLAPGATDPAGLKWDPAIKLSELHANPKCKCILLTYSATWCGACQQEQPTLVTDVGGDPSFCVYEILQEGPNNGTLATQDDVTAWADKFRQNFFMTKGTDQTKQLWNGWAKNGTIGLPFGLIVKPSTMTVLANVQGYEATIHDHAMGLCTQ